MIAVLVAYTEAFDALADVTVPVLRRYCQKQGYDLIVHRGGFGDRSRQFGFQKTELVRSVMPVADALFVVDVDTLITNHSIQLESFCDSDHSMFFTKDENGVNAGSYLAKPTYQTQAILDSVLCCDKSIFPGEQDAMRYIFGWDNMVNDIKFLSHPSINSYLYDEYGKTKTHEEGQWQPGDFLLHLPGMTNERRIEIFKSLL